MNYLICLLSLFSTLVQAQSNRGMKPVVATTNNTVGKRTALVIGNATYTNGGTLRNPLNDARAMSEALQKLGFNVVQRTNLNRDQLETSINDWGKTLSQYEVALFYYAGHGTEANGINYLMPTDANPQNQAQVKLQACPVELVTGWMDIARVRTNIVLLDACRNNPFSRSWSRGATEGGLANMSAPSGTFVGFAASPGKTAADGDRSNGLYTEAIIKNLQTPNLTIDQIFNRVNQYVRQQSGGVQVPFKNSSLEDDFFFATSAPPPVAVVPAEVSVPKKEAPIARTEPPAPTRRNESAKPSTDLEPVPMVFVEGGDFQMGSNDGDSDEKPVHPVTISSFRMASTETTVAQYQKYCEETGTKMPTKPSGGWHDTHPVVNVSWDDAVSFCEWLTRKTGLTYRLPTEAEWEYAARGGIQYRGGSYGGAAGTVGWTNNNSGGKVHPVGVKLPNPLGLDDMIGNVWEWCGDWYDKRFYASSSSKNPTGPSNGESRVLRGGSYLDTPQNCRSALRSRHTLMFRSRDIGFRVVCQVQ